MKSLLTTWTLSVLALAFGLSSVSASPPNVTSNTPQASPAEGRQAIPWSQIGTKAGADYQGDGLRVTATEAGARLHCVFQRLEGEATAEGLWLASTVTKTDRFRVKAAAVGRQSGDPLALSAKGTVTVSDKVVSFVRPELVEEYSVSMDGVRQDFVVVERPAGAGKLQVWLEVAGARVAERASNIEYRGGEGARLVLEGSGRKLAYSRLRATDATGKELLARIGVPGLGGAAKTGTANGSGGGITGTRLVVLVDDAEAVYPVRIDPTFSDANWISMGGIPGANGYVTAAVVDGSGNLYIGGEFTAVGDTTANRIAKWNGTNWSALGSGIGAPDEDPWYAGWVSALAVSGSNVYAGGTFTTAGGIAASSIARWDGSSWSALGSGVGGDWPAVGALAVSGSNVYAGGTFTTAGGSSANHIAKWNGTRWSALGTGMDGSVKALVVSGSDLYAGGGFTTAGGSPVNHIAKWSGTSWSALGSGMNGWVIALAVSGSDLYAGGGFTTAGDVTANSIARWNGTNWSALGSGFTGYSPSVHALAVSGSDVYAGGDFTTAGGIAAFRIARWNGSSWSALGSDVGNYLNDVSALAVSGSDLYVGGDFTKYIAKWDGSNWSTLGSGVDGYVLSLAVSGSNVYVGGQFTTWGGIVASNFAKWDGSSWSALGTGFGGIDYSSVDTLAVSGSNLYAGGRFTTAGGSSANYIAKWDGSSWSALGSGMNDTVNALAVSGGDLYAGGEFTTAGGSSANYIAKWNGTSWSPLGSGVGGDSSPYVQALAVSGNNLYAGGYFTTAGGSSANYIAKWNGTSWSPLGPGIGGVSYPCVRALAVSGSNLCAGGHFTTAGGLVASNIAKWNGSSWTALGSGMNYDVYALAVSGSDVYAGGFFTTAGGSPANRIAKWDGSSWSALGSGMNGWVIALAVSGSDLYAGGGFTIAGGKGACLARAIIPLHGATATATLFGVFVVAVDVTEGGYGYTYAPTVRIIGGGGSGAQAVAVVSNSVVIAVNVMDAGYGYTSTPLIVIDPPVIPNPVLDITPMSFLVFSNLTLGSVYQLQQSVGWYWSNQPVSFTATNALYTEMFPGVVGRGDYRLALHPVPAQAFATAVVSYGFVVHATVTSGGSGYVTSPAVTIAGGGGTNATGVANISGGMVTSITITAPGSGYTDTPTIRIGPPPAAAVSPTVLPVMQLDSASLAPYNNYQIQFKPDLGRTWENWNGGFFSPTDVTDSQYLFITNGVGFFRLQHVP